MKRRAKKKRLKRQKEPKKPVPFTQQELDAISHKVDCQMNSNWTGD